MQLFYNNTINSEDTQITFSKEESRHIIRVLRKKEDDILYITNGDGFLFEAQISFASDKKCTAQIIKVTKKVKQRDYYLHIAIAPTKNNDRFEWFLEKATEIGIDEITPIICSNSERKVVKIERFNKIIQSAMKQSLQFHLPKLNSPVKFADFIKHSPKSKLLIAHCDEQNKTDIKEILEKNTDYTILIGPEGDFSKEEINICLSTSYTPISLGNTRLRTETAGLTVTQNLAFINQ